MVYHIPALEWAPDDGMDEAEMGEELQQQAGNFSEDDMATAAMQSSTPTITSTNTQAADLAAIPKASTPSRKRSKRRAGSADEHSLDRVERMKATKNLDAPPKQGNNPT
jgi:Xaa-Pro aminopeptidase